jgi:hypothetical protein
MPGRVTQSEKQTLSVTGQSGGDSKHERLQKGERFWLWNTTSNYATTLPSRPFQILYSLIILSVLFCYICTALLLGLGCFFSFLIFYTVGRTPWMGDQPIARPLSAHRTTQKQNKRTQTSMPRVGFEHTIPVFQRAKTVGRPRGHCERHPVNLRHII